jgi:hypothetical protein
LSSIKLLEPSFAYGLFLIAKGQASHSPMLFDLQTDLPLHTLQRLAHRIGGTRSFGFERSSHAEVILCEFAHALTLEGEAPEIIGPWVADTLINGRAERLLCFVHFACIVGMHPTTIEFRENRILTQCGAREHERG